MALTAMIFMLPHKLNIPGTSAKVGCIPICPMMDSKNMLIEKIEIILCLEKNIILFILLQRDN